MPLPRIALTPGEPAGIGPDLIVTLAQTARAAELVAIADPELLLSRAAQLGLPLRLRAFGEQAPQPTGRGSWPFCQSRWRLPSRRDNWT